MEFPSYIPPELRDFVEVLDLFFQRSIENRQKLSDKCADRVRALEREGDTTSAATWRRIGADLNRRKERVRAMSESVARLFFTHHYTNYQAIHWLTAAIPEDPARLCQFFYTAITTPTDFDRFREEGERRREMLREFAAKAEDLAQMSHQLLDAITYAPAWPDLSPGPLRETYAPVPADRQLDDLLRLSQSQCGLALAAGLGRQEPPLIRLLDELAQAARRARSEDKGLIGAAIVHRQRNPKMEYLRAFGYSLRAEDFPITENVMMAMAIVTKAVLHPKKIKVDYRDVKRAMDYLEKRGENSGEK